MPMPINGFHLKVLHTVAELDEGVGATTGDVARKLGLERGDAGKTLGLLKGQGYVDRRSFRGESFPRWLLSPKGVMVKEDRDLKAILDVTK